MSPRGPSFVHLEHLSDAGGLYEHAEGRRPRPEHGYCVDDVARGLVVTVREPRPDRRVLALRRSYLAFVLAAQGPDGRFRNRRDTGLRWTDEPSVDDCWGRALWGLGTVVGAPPEAGVPTVDRDAARAAFDRGARLRSPASPRASAFAALGAAAVLRVHPDDPVARALLADAAAQVDPPAPAAGAPVEASSDPGAGWAWPEPRLRYANAVVPEVLLEAGDRLGRPELVERGLHLLGWLLRVQTREGHLSVVPVAGWGPGDLGGLGDRFDQQPIEVAALADACAVAHALTGRPRWRDAVTLALAWFHGDNDSATPMVDLATGGGLDGLMPGGRNENQGAESTLAAVAVLQHGVRMGLAPRPEDLLRTLAASPTTSVREMA